VNILTKISTIVPCHNEEKYVGLTINCLLNQRLKDTEIICVNDHSQDHTLEILLSYEKEYPDRVKVIDLKDGTGCSKARNIGMELANGDYISFVDGDDLISKNMYQNFYYNMKAYDADLTIGNLIRVSEDYQQFIVTNPELPTPFNIAKNKHILWNQDPSCGPKLFRRDLIEGEKFMEGKLYEDLAFTYPVLLKSKRALLFHRADYFYRTNPQGIMSSTLKPNKKILDILDAVIVLRKRCIELGKYAEYEDYIENLIKEHLIYMLSYVMVWEIPELKKQEILNLLQQLCEIIAPNHTEVAEIIRIKLKDILQNLNHKIIVTDKFDVIKRKLEKSITEI